MVLGKAVVGLEVVGCVGEGVELVSLPIGVRIVTSSTEETVAISVAQEVGFHEAPTTPTESDPTRTHGVDLLRADRGERVEWTVGRLLALGLPPVVGGEHVGGDAPTRFGADLPLPGALLGGGAAEVSARADPHERKGEDSDDEGSDGLKFHGLFSLAHNLATG